MGIDSPIRRLHFTEVVVPARAGSVNSPTRDKPLHKLPVAGRAGWSLQFDELPKLVLELELDDGTVGLGEFYRDHDWKTIEGVSRHLIGKRLSDFPLQALPVAWCREYDGFECAVWDAYAKASGLRLVDLLGGALKEKIYVGAWSGHRAEGELGELAVRFSAMGYDCLKLKCDHEDDVGRWCREIAEAEPGMKVILDPNERWQTPAAARKILRQLEAVGNVLCIEDPIPRWMLDDMAGLRQFSSVPVVLHVSLPYVMHGQRPYEAVNALTHSAVDGFNFNGGLANFQRLEHIAAVAGLPCWHGSEIDLGILEAMYLHSSAAAASCSWPGDIFGRLIREHDLLEAPLDIDPPYATLPAGPGLGVALDREALQRYKRDERLYEEE